MHNLKNPITTRERFNRVIHWEKPDKIPNMDFGYWEETIQLWHSQGLPDHIKTDIQMEEYLKLEGESRIPTLPISNGLFPPFENRVIEDKGDSVIVQDHEGNICENLKNGSSIPRYLKFGLESRKDWERYKNERLDYTLPERIGNVKDAVKRAHDSGMPIRFHAGSLYGWLRNWMGVERFSIALMMEQDWISEMMDHLTDMTLYLIEKSFEGLDIDVAWWWEDMCYNKGPLVSPKIFNKLMVPRYRVITRLLKKYNVDVNVLDCDGNIHELTGGWIDAGINCMFPLEALHTDPFVLRKRFGEKLLLMGGVNKVALAGTKDDISREIERIQPLVAQGGYIPTVDHRVPPDVSFDSYLFYLEKKREIL